MPIRIPADADLNTLRTPGFYWCDGSTNANRPDDSGSFCLLIEKTGSWAGNGVKQTYTNYNSGIIYTRVSPTKDVWIPWKPISTATPPQVFALPLAESITTSSRCVYWKNQFNEVTVICDCNIPEGVSATAFAALPSGFRPAARYIFNASMWESGSARSGGCSIDVFPNGQLDFYSGGYTADIRIWGLCKFVAAS